VFEASGMLNEERSRDVVTGPVPPVVELEAVSGVVAAEDETINSSGSFFVMNSTLLIGQRLGINPQLQ
jgi:hypothetical protein